MGAAYNFLASTQICFNVMHSYSNAAIDVARSTTTRQAGPLSADPSSN